MRAQAGARSLWQAYANAMALALAKESMDPGGPAAAKVTVSSLLPT